MQTIALSKVLMNKISHNHMEHFSKCFSYYHPGLLYYCLNAKASFKFDIPLKNGSFLLEVFQNNIVHFCEPEIFSNRISSFFFFFSLHTNLETITVKKKFLNVGKIQPRSFRKSSLQKFTFNYIENL